MSGFVIRIETAPMQMNSIFDRFSSLRPGAATLAKIYAVTRAGLGLWIFVDPAAFGHKWFAAPQDYLLTSSLLRCSGGRDFAIGFGLLFARAPIPWLWLCAFCDVLDASMVFLARSKFTHGEFLYGVVGASSYALIAVAIVVFGSHQRVPNHAVRR